MISLVDAYILCPRESQMHCWPLKSYRIVRARSVIYQFRFCPSHSSRLCSTQYALPQLTTMTEITKWAPDFELPPSEVSPCKSNVKSDKIKLVGYIGLGLAGGPMAENIPKRKLLFARGRGR